MGKKSMVADANAQTPRDPPQYHCDQKSSPTEEEQSGYRADMKGNHN
jgi:hypothetical protein